MVKLKGVKYITKKIPILDLKIGGVIRVKTMNERAVLGAVGGGWGRLGAVGAGWGRLGAVGGG